MGGACGRDAAVHFSPEHEGAPRHAEHHDVEPDGDPNPQVNLEADLPDKKRPRPPHHLCQTFMRSS